MTRPRIAAIVPARGGSRRLPRKNVLRLAGKPLVAHTIEAALQTPQVTAVFVSSEDAEVLRVASEHGAETLERPAALAGDEVPNAVVVRDALETLAAAGRVFDHVVLLQPTSPLRSARHLEACLTAYLASGAASAVSVCPAEHHPATMLTLRDGIAEPYEAADTLDTRREALPPVFRQNGAIYALAVERFLAEGRFVVAPSIPYIMSREESVDVDEPTDLLLAEALLRKRGA